MNSGQEQITLQRPFCNDNESNVSAGECDCCSEAKTTVNVSSSTSTQLGVVAGGKNGRFSKKFKTCNAGALKRCLSKVRISYGWLCSAGCLAGLRWSSFNSGHRGDIIGWILSIVSKVKVFFSFDQFSHFLISLSLSLSVRPSCRPHHHGQGCGCILAGNKASALQPLDKVSPTKNMLCFFLINWQG